MSSSIAELLKKLGELDSLLASKESECRDMRIERNAIQLAIGALQRPTNYR